jgi:thymidylate kinase
LERLDPSFHQLVRDGFLELAANDSSFVVIDGNQSLAAVTSAVDFAFATRLGIEVSSS